MKANLQETEASAYLERCANLVLRADHHVLTLGQAYDEIESAAGVRHGTIAGLIKGWAAPLDILAALEGVLVGEESLLDALQARLDATGRDLAASRDEAAAHAEAANEARAALNAEVDSHARTHEALATLAAQHAIAMDKLLESRRLSQRISGQFEMLGSALYDVSTGQDELAEVLADGQR